MLKNLKHIARQVFSKRGTPEAITGKGDTLHVCAVDLLGRDAIDVQTTVRDLLAKGVTLHVHSIGPIGAGAGEIIIAVLAQMAAMERRRIAERTEAGRMAARKALAATGRTPGQGEPWPPLRR